MNTKTGISVTITYTDSEKNVRSMAGWFDSLQSMTDEINNFIGAHRVHSIEFNN